VIVVSPSASLLGVAVDAARGLKALRCVVAPTLIEGRVFAEVVGPSALLVDSAFSEEGRGLLLAAATIVAATPVALGGSETPRGFAARLPAERGAIRQWLSSHDPVGRPAPDEADMLAVVRARYAQSLGEKAAQLAGLSAAVLEDSASSEALEQAKKVAHRLRGSAGSYGFPAFGEVAAAIDTALLGGVAQPPAASLRRGVEILALWRGGADPWARPWPLLKVVGEHRHIGELAPLAHASRVDVELELDASLASPSSECVARFYGADARAGTRPASAEHELRIDGEVVRITQSGDSFPRSALASRLPALLRRWSEADTDAT